MIKGKDFNNPTVPIIIVVIASLIVILLLNYGRMLGFILPSFVIAIIITSIHDWLGSTATWFSFKGVTIAFVFVLISMLWSYFIH